MAKYQEGYEIRHAAPGPEAADGRKKAKDKGDPMPGFFSTGSAAEAGVQAAGERAHCEIPGQLAPQVTKPNA